MPAEPEEYEFGVSSAQARLLVLERTYGRSAQYHIPVGFEVRGHFDPAAFRRAYHGLVARHDALRTRFRVDGDEHVQVVAAESAATVVTHPEVTASEVAAAMRAEAARPFDIETGPLLRCVVYPVDDGSHRVLITVHHLVCDGWSLQVMLRELAAGYRAALAGTPDPAQTPPIQYPDYAAWQRERLDTGGYDRAVGYWRDLLDQAPAILPLPTDRPRPARQTPAGGSVRFVLAAATRERLAALGREHATTAFAVLFAAFNAFLSRVSGQRDLVVGVPVAGRDHQDLQGMVGMLTNTLPLRTDVSDEVGFGDLIDLVRDNLGAALRHQDAPYHAVVEAVTPERSPSYDPVVQVVFNYDDETESRLDLPDAEVHRVELELDVAKFDLLMQVERRGPDLVAWFNYRSDLFQDATVRHWVRSFQTMLRHLLDDPATPIPDAVLLDPGQRHTVLDGWNGPASPIPERLVPDLIAERAAERPDATAVRCGEVVLSYRELLTRADRLAERLADGGVGPGVPVGLCLPRSAAMAVTALAVLRAGGAYLPLDPEQPVTRLRRMVTDAGAALVVTTPGGELADALPVPVATVERDGAGFVVPPPAAPGRPVARRPGPRDLAYLLFTSGSTGVPKAVGVEHRALSNLATAVRPRFPVTAEDRVLQYVAFGFDVSVSDLFFTWVAGAELHIAQDHERLGDTLYDRLRDSRITYVFLPPSAAMSLPCPPGALPHLRTMAIGGEAVPPVLVERWATERRRVVDAYGPSEATVYATLADLVPGRPVVIGRPVPNTRAYLLDRRLRPVPVGVVGEIYLAGAGLARGYVNRPGLSAERFVADPYGPSGSRMYRTGDLGRYDAEGVFSYLGRTDQQVKVRGFRVELGEIEAVLAEHPRVAAAAATAYGDGDRRRLAGYVVPLPGQQPPGVRELRGWLAERLPGYMVPETIVALPELPLGRTGKVDRGRLPEPTARRPDLDHPRAAVTGGTQRRVAAVWARILELDEDHVGADDNFFDLGGNSIRLLSVLTALREAGWPDLTMVDLFRQSTVATLAAHLDVPAGAGGAAGREDSRRRGQDRRDRLERVRARRSGSTKGGTR